MMRCDRILAENLCMTNTCFPLWVYSQQYFHGAICELPFVWKDHHFTIKHFAVQKKKFLQGILTDVVETLRFFYYHKQTFQTVFLILFYTV